MQEVYFPLLNDQEKKRRAGNSIWFNEDLGHDGVRHALLTKRRKVKKIKNVCLTLYVKRIANY